jgi:hypothetical protein
MITNIGLGKIWQEAKVAVLKNVLIICYKEGNVSKTLHDSRFLGPSPNREPTEFYITRCPVEERLLP